MNDITTDLAVRLVEPVGMIRNLMANKASEAIALVGAERTIGHLYAENCC